MVVGGDVQHVDAFGEAAEVEHGAFAGNRGGKHLLAANVIEGDGAGGGGALHGAVVGGGIRHHAGVEAVTVDAGVGGGELLHGTPVAEHVVAAVAAYIHVVAGLRIQSRQGVVVRGILLITGTIVRSCSRAMYMFETV